jgi:hypothetical protein
LALRWQGYGQLRSYFIHCQAISHWIENDPSDTIRSDKGNYVRIAHKTLFALVIGLIAMASLPACSSAQSTELHMMPMDQMPADVQSAPVTVQQAYQFAAANPDVMQNIPCYCGCGNIGHTSNYDCYVAGVDEKAVITFDSHALGCSICVDITQDTMRLLREGKSVPEIRAAIDATYSKYGPSNIPSGGP